MEHTKTPWTCRSKDGSKWYPHGEWSAENPEEGFIQSVAIGDGNEVIALVLNTHLTGGNLEANARRIVAAVNAVEGIETEVLEFAAGENLRLDFTGRADRITKLENSVPAINARLLALLKQLLENCELGHWTKQIRAAIAEAENTEPPHTRATII